MSNHWIAERTKCFDSSGIRKVFDLAAKLKDPINLSIGQPDFDVPEPVRQAAIDAIQSRKNGYALTQGMPVLRDKLQAQVDAAIRPRRPRGVRHQRHQRRADAGAARAGQSRRRGDRLRSVLRDVRRPGRRGAAARCVYVDTYPDFRIDLDRVAAAITPRTKAIIVQQPGQSDRRRSPRRDEVRGLAELAAERNVVLISDEIYRAFCYDGPFVSPAKYNPQTLVIDGFSKTYGMTGWRLGFAHGPRAIIQRDDQAAAVQLRLRPAARSSGPAPRRMDVDMTPHIDAYRRKRDLIVDGPRRTTTSWSAPGGAFYAFPKAPWGTATEFVTEAIEKHQLLIIPGNVFSRRDTHFRISYAAADAVIERGIEVLRKIAKR